MRSAAPFCWANILFGDGLDLVDGGFVGDFLDGSGGGAVIATGAAVAATITTTVAAELAGATEGAGVVFFNDGLLLLMFPEGTRSRDRQLHRGFPGTALVAYRTGAPIIPVAITGTEGLPWPWVFVRPFIGPRVTVTIGKAFYPPAADRITTQAARDATDAIMLQIAELLPESYQGEFRDAVAREREGARSVQAQA